MAGEIGGALGALGLLGLRLGDFAGNMPRQQDAEGCPGPRRAATENIAASLLDNAVDHGEAEPGALADVLGGEEGLEDFRHHLGGDAMARVLDFDQHVFGGNQ